MECISFVVYKCNNPADSELPILCPSFTDHRLCSPGSLVCALLQDGGHEHSGSVQS